MRERERECERERERERGRERERVCVCVRERGFVNACASAHATLRTIFRSTSVYSKKKTNPAPPQASAISLMFKFGSVPPAIAVSFALQKDTAEMYGD